MKNYTMSDVANLAGVSQSTVSFVLNNNKKIAISDEVKKKIYDAVEQLNFKPRVKRKNFTKMSDNTIALFIPNVSNLFYPDLIKCVDQYASLKGFRLIIINTNRDAKNEEYYFDLLTNIKIAGIIYGFTPTLSDIDSIRSLHIPLIVIGESLAVLNADVISLNSFKSGEIIAKHLYELGHRKIAYITTPTDTISISRKNRLYGIEKFLLDKEDTILKVLMDNNEQELPNSNYELEIGYNMINRLIISNFDVTAIICTNDMIAYGVIKSLTENNIKIPDEISVCGFDNLLFSSLITPSLTTIDHCTNQRCRLAIDILVDKITGNFAFPMKINYEPILIKRNSTSKYIENSSR